MEEQLYHNIQECVMEFLIDNNEGCNCYIAWEEGGGKDKLKRTILKNTNTCLNCRVIHGIYNNKTHINLVKFLNTYICDHNACNFVNTDIWANEIYLDMMNIIQFNYNRDREQKIYELYMNMILSLFPKFMRSHMKRSTIERIWNMNLDNISKFAHCFKNPNQITSAILSRHSKITDDIEKLEI